MTQIAGGKKRLDGGDTRMTGAAIRLAKMVSAALLLVLLTVSLIHSLEVIKFDLARMLASGSVIWQSKLVPTINLFSFTEPDQEFLNHHWLSEVFVYSLHVLGGMPLIQIASTMLALAAALIPVVIVWRLRDEAFAHEAPLPPLQAPGFLAVAICGPLAVLMFTYFSAPRPQNVSFLMFSIFMAILLHAKYTKQTAWLWLLPPLQALWVNFHVFFFLGPVLAATFFIDRLYRLPTEPWRGRELRRLIVLGTLLGLALCLNPEGLRGALYPLSVVNKTPMEVMEMRSPLVHELDKNWTVIALKISIPILLLSFLLARANRRKIFEICVTAFLLYATLKMLRNIPFWALWFFPIAVMNALDGWARAPVYAGKKAISVPVRWIKGPRGAVSAALLLGGIALPAMLTHAIVTNQYYKQTGESRRFGWAVPKGALGGAGFILQHQLKGPIFNDFNVGSMLIWKLYHNERVFIDGRGDAYSSQFYNKIYLPMLESREGWLEHSERYGINLIVLGHDEASPDIERFLAERLKDPKWRLVYVDESVTIFLKAIEKNQPFLNQYAITPERVLERPEVRQLQAQGDALALRQLGRFFFLVGWVDPARIVLEQSLKLDPDDAQTALVLGLANSSLRDRRSLEQAALLLRYAIDHGQDIVFHRLTLGRIYYQLGQKDKAWRQWQVLRNREPYNPDIPDLIEQFIKKASEEPAIGIEEKHV